MRAKRRPTRLVVHGPNVVCGRAPAMVIVELLLRFGNPLVLLLLGAAPSPG